VVEICWDSEFVTQNVHDKVAGISLRRRDQFKPDVV